MPRKGNHPFQKSLDHDRRLYGSSTDLLLRRRWDLEKRDMNFNHLLWKDTSCMRRDMNLTRHILVKGINLENIAPLLDEMLHLKKKT